MKYQEIKKFISTPEKMNLRYIRFVDDERFVEENTTLAPGAIISRYGFWVIATSIGGNVLTISDNDDILRFCGHSGWYDDFHTAAVKSDYSKRKYSRESVMNSQLEVAHGIDEFMKLVIGGEFEKLVEKHG